VTDRYRHRTFKRVGTDSGIIRCSVRRVYSERYVVCDARERHLRQATDLSRLLKNIAQIFASV